MAHLSTDLIPSHTFNLIINQYASTQRTCCLKPSASTLTIKSYNPYIICWCFTSRFSTPAGNGKKSSMSPTPTFSKQYPCKEPSYPKRGTYDGIVDSIILCIGVSISRDTNNTYLLCPDGVFFYRAKARKAGQQQGELNVISVLDDANSHSLMMGGNVIIDSDPFHQYGTLDYRAGIRRRWG